jgi:hypothetical protein
MTRLSRLKRLISGALTASLALQPLAANAALHQLSFIKTESATLQTLDLTANADWDFDATPVKQSLGGQPLDRAYITDVFAQMAKSMFTMTEGRHRIGTVFVYPNSRFGGGVDMRLIAQKPGRSNANAPGWGMREGHSANYVVDDSSGTPKDETKIGLGQVIAHENGHYLYGLFDEYREAGTKLNPDQPSAPSEVDTPLNTLMHDQYSFASLSTPADNVEPTNTAQKRVYGASAWEVLARPTTSDPAAAQNLERTAFAAFAGFVPPNAAALTRPVAGWDAAFKVVFLPNPLNSNVYIISRAGSNDQLAAVKNAVLQSLRALPLAASSVATVITYGGNSGAPQLLSGPAAIDTETARAAAIAAVEAITTDPIAGSLEPAVVSVLDEVARQYAANQISLGDGITMHLFAGAQDAISAATRDRIKSLRVAVNASVLTSFGPKRAEAMGGSAPKAMRDKATASTVTLAQLSHASGGLYTNAHSAAALTTGALKAQASSAGTSDVALENDYRLSLGAGERFDMKSAVIAKTDGKLSFTANWSSDSDSSKIRYELTAPDGTRFAPANPAANQSFANGAVTYVMNADAASAHFEVAKGFAGSNGVWTSSVIAGAAIAAPIMQESEAQSELDIEIDVVNDGKANPILTTRLGTDRALQGALVTATFYDANGDLKLTKTLLDDGKSGDAKAGDGVYSASVANQLAAGQYDVVVRASAGPNGVFLSTKGSTRSGVNSAPEALGGAFNRTAETLLTIAATTVVEYYVPSLKKYFITGRDSEKATLAQFPNVYSLTGMSFVAGPGLAPPAGTQPICRFYFAPPLANTHFYGPPADCAVVESAFKGNVAVTNEGVDFAIAIPDAAGNCPASAPFRVNRSFNNRGAQNDGNHRYTVSLVSYSRMSLLGYASEGAVFCATSVTDATSGF